VSKSPVQGLCTSMSFGRKLMLCCPCSALDVFLSCGVADGRLCSRRPCPDVEAGSAGRARAPVEVGGRVTWVWADDDRPLPGSVPCFHYSASHYSLCTSRDTPGVTYVPPLVWAQGVLHILKCSLRLVALYTYITVDTYALGLQTLSLMYC